MFYYEKNSASVQRLKKFRDALGATPAPGAGCHPHLLRVAFLGVRAGLPADRLASLMRSAIPPGVRVVPDQEIHDAICKAADTCSMRSKPYRSTCFSASRSTKKKVAPVSPQDAERLRASIINKGGGACDLDEMRATSPIPLGADGLSDTIAFLAAAYAPNEKVFIGRKLDSTLNNVRMAWEWQAFFYDRLIALNAMSGDQRSAAELQLAERYSHFVPNPLTGDFGPTKDGQKLTCRGDSCVATFRWAIVEFDNLPPDQQVAFFKGLGWPCTALIFSGVKSVHALFRVDVPDVAAWNSQVEGRLYDFLTPLGADSACKNECRMSRLPGIRRLRPKQDGAPCDPGAYQRLLWLARDGGEVLQ